MTSPLIVPPRARLAFRVGVVGHRPNRLPEGAGDLVGLKARLVDVLEGVRAAVIDFKAGHADAALYAPDPPLLRAVSPLAEGADRMFAEAAMDLDYALCCPMPFHQAAFEEDFSEDSRAVFRALLHRARALHHLTTFQLDGMHEDADAYGPAGRVVLNQSDLLVAVWDGDKRRDGAGGTLATMREAIDFQVPVLWIDAHAPFGWTVLRTEADLACLNAKGRCTPGPPAADPREDRRRLAEAITGVVTEELALAAADDKEDPPPRVRVEAFFRERRPSLNLGFLWKPFRDLVGSGKISGHRFKTPDYIEATRGDWPVAGDPPIEGVSAPTDIASWINGALRPYYAWSDQLADHWADAHRTAFVAAALLAAAAVLGALLPMVFGRSDHERVIETACIVGEMLILTVMVALLQRGRSQRWHQRWMEYRVLAELIRQLRFMIPLGGGRPLPRTPEHLKVYGDPARSWMHWHVRAIARATGLPEAVATAPYMRERVGYLKWITGNPESGQWGFHTRNRARCVNLHHRLHDATLLLFGLTILAIVLHLGLHLGIRPVEAWAPPWLSGALIVASAVLPALGAALASINNQGEFARLAKRSSAMADGFEAFDKEIAALGKRLDAHDPTMRLAAVTDLAGRMAGMMVDEVIDWRVVVLDLPHAAG